MNQVQVEEALCKLKGVIGFVRWVEKNYRPGVKCENSYDFTINGRLYHIPITAIEAGLKDEFGTLLSMADFFGRVDAAAAKSGG